MPIEQIIVTDDGYRVDPETGEVLGFDSETPTDFIPFMDFVLQRRAQAEARAAGLTAEMNLLVAGIKERFETRIAEQTRKVEWLDAQHGPAIQKWAHEQIEGGKAKSVKTAWATLGFRASREKMEVLDPQVALDWAKDNCPEAVRIEEKLLVSAIPDDLKTGELSGLEYHPAGERQDFYCKHGGTEAP